MGPSDAALSTSMVSAASHEDSGPRTLEAPQPRLLLHPAPSREPRALGGAWGCPSCSPETRIPGPVTRTKAMTLMTHSDTCRDRDGARGHAKALHT